MLLSDFSDATPSTVPPDLAGRRAAGADRCPVIVVDDDVDTAESLAALLRLHGYDAREVCDPAAALATASALCTRAALIDVQMPGLYGLELARRFRRDPVVGANLLIAVSGWARPFDVQRARAAGFDAYLIKPFDVGELLRLLAPIGDWAKSAS